VSTNSRFRFVLGFLAFIPLAADKPREAGEMPLAIEDDFEREKPTGWTFTDANAWRIAKVGKVAESRVLEQFRASKYEPRVRSPFNIGLNDKNDLGDFVMDVDVRSTTRDYPHRDLCLVFGYRDPSHFYYVHLGKAADEHANSIFLVDDKPRVSIAATRTKGTPWTDGWHHVRVIRKLANGLIEVYFDDMKTAAMTARDKTLGAGKIGLGSFDDTGMFDALRVWATPGAPRSSP
jgi:hypothetical protein